MTARTVGPYWFDDSGYISKGYGDDYETICIAYDQDAVIALLNTLTAENAALRGALGDIIRGFEAHLQDQACEAKLGSARLVCPCWDTVIAKARAALAQGK